MKRFVVALVLLASFPSSVSAQDKETGDRKITYPVEVLGKDYTKESVRIEESKRKKFKSSVSLTVDSENPEKWEKWRRILLRDLQTLFDCSVRKVDEYQPRVCKSLVGLDRTAMLLEEKWFKKVGYQLLTMSL